MSQYVHSIHRIIPHHPVEVDSASFPDGVFGQPPRIRSFVKSEPVVIKPCLNIEILRAEPDRIRIRDGVPIHADRLAKRAVFVAGAEGVGGEVDEFRDVAVAVVAGSVGSG